MPMLDCSVESCAYNKETRCCKSDIQVEGSEAKESKDTCCSSFRDGGCIDKYTSAYTVENPSPQTGVDCTAATCIYNQSSRCDAGHIGIMGGHCSDSHQTECAAFICR